MENKLSDEAKTILESFRKNQGIVNYDWSTVCNNCQHTLGEHKGKDFYCVTGPRAFKTIIEGSHYSGELIPA